MKENFRRLGENYAGAVKTSAMSAEAIRPHLSFAGGDKVLKFRADGSDLLRQRWIALRWLVRPALLRPLDQNFQCLLAHRDHRFQRQRISCQVDRAPVAALNNV